MSEMRDDLLATLGAAQEDADLTALADSFCQRWEKQARKERRITPPPWSGWFEFFGWAWVMAGMAALSVAVFMGTFHDAHSIPLFGADCGLWFTALVLFVKWIGVGSKQGKWDSAESAKRSYW